MKLVNQFFALNLLLLTSGIGLSQENPNVNTIALDNATTAYYLAIKGGVSLGSYETGINRSILKYLENKKDAELVSFSGASAGSLNSVLSAIDICLPDKKIIQGEIPAVEEITDTLDSNFMRHAWDLGIGDLVPEDEKNNSYKTLYKFDRKKRAAKDVGLFSRESFDNKKILIKQLLNRDGKNGCELTITMSVTKFKAHKFEVNEIGATIQLQRFVVAIDVLVDPEDNKIKFKNSELQVFNKKGSAIPSQYLKLVEDENGIVHFDEVWNLAMASSAFPLAFHPVELSFCFPYQLKDMKCTRGRASSELFSDGGLFDNSPIGVAWEIAKHKSSAYDSTKLVYINPDSYRSSEGVIKKVKTKSNVGIAEYANYFSDSFLTAHELEYKASLGKILDSNIAARSRVYYMTNRYHHLLADLHAHFGAFYAAEYRMHDYLVGVYDGNNLTAQLDCDETEFKYGVGTHDRFSSRYRECVRERILHWVGSLNPDQHNQASIEFVRYLYDSEYDRSLVSYSAKQKTDNTYIALSQAFGTINKSNSQKIQYIDYLENLRFFGSALKLEPGSDLYQILHNGKTFTSRKISKMFENIIQMQDLSASCELCDGKEINDGIGTGFKILETVIDSYLSHHESNIWPKPFFGSLGLSYGFNVNQKNQVYSLDFRPIISSLAVYKLSVDLSLNFHDIGGELGDDDYESISVGLVRHTDNLILPTWGLGYQYETKGRHIYDESLQSIFLKASFLNEIFTIKYLHRIEAIKQFPVQSRDDDVVVLSTDMSRICQMVFPSWCRL